MCAVQVKINVFETINITYWAICFNANIPPHIYGDKLLYFYFLIMFFNGTCGLCAINTITAHTEFCFAIYAHVDCDG